MPTAQHIRSLRRTAVGKFVVLVPALVVGAMIIGTLACRTPSGSSSGSATATPTAGTGALAFVTNFNDAKVSSFTRNTSTGVLKHTGQVTAGAKQGPKGVVAAPSGSFLYVANNADDKIYEFSINPNNGVLTPISPPSVSNGNHTGPDELAFNPSGSLLWVTGSGNGTVTSYTVNTSTGQITKSGSLGGFNTPFGIAVHPLLSVIYVSDSGSGVIQPMTYNSSGVLAKSLPAVMSSDPLAVKPGLVAVDSGGDALFVPDQGNGEVSSFSINGSTGALTPILAFANSAVDDVPIGIGIGNNAGVDYVFTANQGVKGSVAGSVSSFVQIGTSLTVPPTVAGPYNGPTVLVVDPLEMFVYTTDNFDGTVSQSTIKGSCGSQICVGSTVATENPPKANSGPFGMTFAQ